MQKALESLETPMVGLTKGDWLEALATASDEMGFFEPLGTRHYASFVEHSDTLLVTFENLQGIQSLSENGQPLGWDMVRENGWSHLCLISDGDTWFRDGEVYEFLISWWMIVFSTITAK